MKWPADQLAEMLRDYPTTSTEELARRYGRTIQAVRSMAGNFGICKDDLHRCKRRDGSLMTQALARLRDVQTLPERDFTRLLIDIAGDKEKAHNLRSEMGKQGFLSHFVAITEPARKAMEALT